MMMENTYRPYQMYQIFIYQKEVKEIIKDLNRRLGHTANYTPKNKFLMDMSVKELKDFDDILAVESRETYDKVSKRLIVY